VSSTTATRSGFSSLKADTPEDKLRSIVASLDRLGLLDLASGFLEDEHQLEKLIKLAASDSSLELLAKVESLSRLVAKPDYRGLENILTLVSETRGSMGITKAIELLRLLDEKGLIDPLIGVLQDDQTFGKIIGLLSDEKVLSLLAQRDKILGVISTLDYDKVHRLLDALNNTPGIVEALTRLVELLAELSRRGVIDPLIGLLQDEKMFGAIVNLVASDQFLELVQHSQKLFTLLLNLADVDEELLNLITAMQTTTFKRFLSAFSSIGKEEPKPVRGVLGTMRQLGDRDVSVGLGVVFQFLAKLGQEYTKEQTSSTKQTTTSS
jgi:uncharacterized protein YjgD (DUF1641 family)